MVQNLITASHSYVEEDWAAIPEGVVVLFFNNGLCLKAQHCYCAASIVIGSPEPCNAEHSYFFPLYGIVSTETTTFDCSLSTNMLIFWNYWHPRSFELSGVLSSVKTSGMQSRDQLRNFFRSPISTTLRLIVTY